MSARSARDRAMPALRRLARRPRAWFATVRARRSTETTVRRGRDLSERFALAARGVRGRHARAAEWARLEQQVRALPAPASSPRSISVVRLEFDGARFTHPPVDPDADLVCFLHPSSASIHGNWLARLAAVVDGTNVVAAAPLVVHPLRPAPRATPHDGRVRARGVSLGVADRAPVLLATDAGTVPSITDEPVAVLGATAACIVVDRRAYEAASPVDGIHDIDLATFELCRRLRANGGTVMVVPDAVVIDRRPVASRLELVEAVSTSSDAWRDYVEARGPALMHVADPLDDGALRIALTVAAPSEKVAPRWGDWHLARAFARALRRRGHVVRVQTLDHADDLAGRACDVHVVVRGLGGVRRTAGQAHVLWIISHPESVTTEECDDADLVLVASVRFADELRTRTRTPVEVLLQATDVTLFRPMPIDPVHVHDVTVVAKSRDVFRTAVADAIAGGIRPAIYGSGWEPFVDPALVVGDYVPNEELPVVYSSAGVLLNDHWDSMHEWGFVSNRIFDALGCGTPVISDDLPEIADLFDGAVLTYRDAPELRALVDSVLSDRTAASARAGRGRELVTERHTFDHRAEQLLDALDRYGLTKP